MRLKEGSAKNIKTLGAFFFSKWHSSPVKRDAYNDFLPSNILSCLQKHRTIRGSSIGDMRCKFQQTGLDEIWYRDVCGETAI